MNDQADAATKSDPSTPHKRKEAKRQGNVVKSQELVAVTMATVGLLGLASAPWGGWVSDIRHWIAGSVNSASGTDRLAQAGDRVISMVGLCVPILLAMVAAAVIVNVVQVGFRWVPNQVSPNFDKVNPATGLKRIYRDNAWIDSTKGILKISVLFVVLWIGFQQFVVFCAQWIRPLDHYFDFLISQILIGLMPVLVLLGVLDYVWLRHRYLKRLRMSKAEIKEEFKRREGDPKIKNRVRDYQRELLTKIQASSHVKTCDLVVVNPTHYAVSLNFDINVDVAPKIVAKGKNKWAEKIKRIARQHGRPVIESAALARDLFELPIGCPISEQFYGPVGGLYRKYVVRPGSVNV